MAETFQGGRDHPWAYDDLVDAPEQGVPRWSCPEGICDCHAGGKVTGRPHRILLYDESANAMPGARCRVWCGQVLVNRDQRYANGKGAVDVMVPEGTSSLLVEWAPRNMPMDDRFPFRLHYFVDMAQDGVGRRLHNAGFFQGPTPEDNVKHFQATYGPPGAPRTGRREDIAAQLGAYHDVMGLPPIRDHGSDGEALPHTPSLPVDLSPAPGQGCAREPRATAPFEVGITVDEHDPWTDDDNLVIVDAAGDVKLETRLGDARADGSLRRVQFSAYTKNERYTVKVRFGDYAYVLYENVSIYNLVSPATPYATARRPHHVFVDERTSTSTRRSGSAATTIDDFASTLATTKSSPASRRASSRAHQRSPVRPRNGTRSGLPTFSHRRSSGASSPPRRMRPGGIPDLT